MSGLFEMSGRVSLGGHEMDLQEAVDSLAAGLDAARVAASLPIAQALNETVRETIETAASIKPSYELVGTIEQFTGDRPDAIIKFFETIDNVGELSNWTDAEKLKVARLKLTGPALSFIRSEDQERVANYADFRKVLSERFSDKAPRHCYFQQLSEITQRRGEPIESFADRVKALTEKTVRVTANPEVNAALREEADRRALEAFVRGLLGPVREQTRLKFPETLRDAVATAVAVEHILRPQHVTPSDRKVFRTEVTCYRCHKTGHLSRECPETEGSGNERSRNLKCWRCSRTGHRRADCRARMPPQPARSGNQSGNDYRAGVNAGASPRQ